MRRRVALTALAVSLFALSCTEDRPEGPTGPSSPAAASKVCPSNDPIQQQICVLFRPTDNLASANDLYNNIKTKKQQNRTADAQARAIDLVNFTFKQYYAGKLLDPNGPTTPPTTSGGVIQLTCDVLGFVSTTASPTSCGDLATTGLTPSSPHSTIQICGPAGCLVEPQDKHSGVSVPAGACPTPCIISVDPLPVNQGSPRDGPLSGLTNLDQYPLFREFRLSAAFTEFSTKVLVGICHLKASDGGPFAPPDDATEARLQLAHPDPNNSEGIEILAKVNAPFLDCSDLLASSDEFTPVIGSTGRSHLWGLAAAAQSMFGRALSPMLETLLPERAEAAVLGSCCLGGAASKFSPWAAVDPESGSELIFYNDRGSSFDPGGQTLYDGAFDVLRWQYNPIGQGNLWAYPAVQFLDGSGTPQTDITVTVSLIPVDGSTGTLSGTFTASTSEFTGVPTAFFDDLKIDVPGTYKLKFEAPGATPIESGAFTVTEPVIG